MMLILEVSFLVLSVVLTVGIVWFASRKKKMESLCNGNDWARAVFLYYCECEFCRLRRSTDAD